MKKMTLVYKIAFSAMMIAIYIVLSRFLAVPSLFGIPFLKISVASLVISFSSLYLGPVFGLIVGTFGDIIGALAFPQGEFNILFTIAASLGGLMPALIYMLFKKLKFDRKKPLILGIILGIVCLTITLFTLLNDDLGSYYSSKSYELTIPVKIGIIVSIWVLAALYFVGSIIIKNKFKDKNINKYYDIYLICDSIFITYFLFKIPTSSLVFMYVYELNFFVVFGSRMLLGFFNSFVDIIACVVFLNLSTRFLAKGYLQENVVREEIVNE